MASMFTWVEISRVVAIRACPASSCMTLEFTPFTARIVRYV